MSNDVSLNSWEVNATLSDLSLSLDVISFDNYGLQNKNVVTEWDWFWLRDYSDRRIDLTDTPQWDGQILNDSFFGWRTIDISWYLIADNKSALDDLIDEFKLSLSKRNRLLKWKINDEIRQLYATVTELTFWTKENIYIPFDLTFSSQNSYWSKEKQQSLLIEWLTTSPRIDDINNKWEISKPLWIFWFKTASWVDTIDIKVWWIGCIISETIVDWDILVVNWETWIITLNWNQVDFEWVIPIFNSWYNNSTLEINWTFEVDVNIVFPYNLM